jgi:trimethylamine--corrinoid protein Co-methyltransferase
MSDREARRARRNKRRAQRRGALEQLPWRSLVNPYDPIEVLSTEQIEALHDASMLILEDIGMDFLHDEALDVLSAAGAEVTSGTQRVRFDRHMVGDAIASVPESFTLHARNPEHNLTIGPRSINFGAVASPPNASDADAGRRVGNFNDYCNLLRLGQYFNVIHFFGGYPVEPVDLPPSTRHLDCLSAFVTLTDKAFHSYSLGSQRMRDGLEIVRIGYGLTEAEMMEQPSVMSVVNTSSPLRLDGPMIEGLIEMARMNQPVVVTPFTLSGAMAPATLAGAIAQQNAEALATIAFTQLVNPGAPAVYGAFTSNVDMKTGAPAFGTPEFTRAALAGGQMARRYGIPYRSTGATSGNAVDAQAAYESQMSLWGAVMGHAAMVIHGAGWMEGGLVANFEKFVIDVEMLQMMAEFMQGVAVNADELALDAIAEVGPGGHFFGAAHTLERYETAFYAPLVSDWSNYESWVESGSTTAEQRANRIWKQVLAEYVAPPLEGDRAAALEDFVTRRKEEGGVG